jgi:hypothetical protein
MNITEVIKELLLGSVIKTDHTVIKLNSDWFERSNPFSDDLESFSRTHEPLLRYLKDTNFSILKKGRVEELLDAPINNIDYASPIASNLKLLSEGCGLKFGSRKVWIEDGRLRTSVGTNLYRMFSREFGTPYKRRKK